MKQRRMLTPAQKDAERKGFADWMSALDFQLHEFIASLPHQTAAAMDFGRASLDVLEAWLLANYPSVDALRAESEKANWDRVGRYIGETFRRTANGKWAIELDPRGLFFRLPIIEFLACAPICPHSLGTAALDRRTGHYIGPILDHMIAEQKLVAAGKAAIVEARSGRWRMGNQPKM